MENIYPEYENTDSMVRLLTVECLSIIRTGDLSHADRYIMSGAFRDFQKSTLAEGFEYARTTYLYSCIAYYTALIMGNVPLSSAVGLLSKSTGKKYRTAEEYISALPGLLISFTKLAGAFSDADGNNYYINRASQYIRDNLYGKIQADDLTRYCGCSLSYLRHLIKKETGQTLNEYITDRKISRACDMLKDSSMSPGQIAAQLGFSSESYFIVQFKKIKGLTPGMYRKTVRSTTPTYAER